MAEIVLSIGSNCEERKVAEAIRFLEGLLTDSASSSIYRTPGVKENGVEYSNAVMCGKVSCSFDELNASLKDYEIRAGRDEECRRRGLVPIDIDIVIWNGEVVREWDYRQTFFKIGFLELSCPVVKE